ncbi:MAG: hypothetical protein GEV12_10020 [Micromonosporaceae bacterium]|nr:hypothetical protein [Micromonosporaceae bacterium]
MSARVRPCYAGLATLAVLLISGAAACGDEDASDLPPPAPPPSAANQTTPGLDLSPAEQAALANDPMAEVNAELGFHPDREWREYEADVLDLVRQLNTAS